MIKSSELDAVISAFGKAVKSKLANSSIRGSAEDQLRAPLETLFQALATIVGKPPGTIELVGEASLATLSTRPDYAVTNRHALIGYIEVKAPGKGADPYRFSDKHDKQQWQKLKCLPNLLYTDGNEFSCWKNGELQGRVLRLLGDVKTSGTALKAPEALVGMISAFLEWNPLPPLSAKGLAEDTARLCRFLRDEVFEEMDRHNPALMSLAEEWRGLLFPEASDAQFADGYAQAVTFGLLIAKAEGISLADGIGRAALELRSTNTLIGTALLLLTDDRQTEKSLETSLRTLVRVIDAINWSELSKGSVDTWLYFYEDFLAIYDTGLRKKTGSYYTPPEVVNVMVRLVDEALRDPEVFGLPLGLSDPNVKICDPAVGTGTYLLGVLRKVSRDIEEDLGAGAVPSAIAALTSRLIGFEIQFGPFAVAQLRLTAEIQNLMALQAGPSGQTSVQPRLYITDTLGDPYAAQSQFSTMLAPVGRSKSQANEIKRDEEITVVIGNPPYGEKAKGRGAWIEQGTSSVEPPLKRWIPPRDWDISAHSKHLYNLYVYFWRWATWKVFGLGQSSAAETCKDRFGVICFITPTGFLNGPGFEKMRADLRRECSHIWIIHCSPEGHQPGVPTRIFQGVQQPVCIVMCVRPRQNDANNLTKAMFHSLGEGPREEKFTELAGLSLGDRRWATVQIGLRAPFLPNLAGAWQTFPSLQNLFVYDGTGVMAGRTWVIAPDRRTLEHRWNALTREQDATEKERLFQPHPNGDRSSKRISRKRLPGYEHRAMPVANDLGAVIEPCRYAFRSFDRQWIIPDVRLINRPNPNLWSSHSSHQIYLTAPTDRSPTKGPAVSFTEIMPDLHHYNGKGGRVFPLWREEKGEISNIKQSLLRFLSAKFGRSVSAEDIMSYLAAILSHSNFTARYLRELKSPGLRVPITADSALFFEAIDLGREVIWLHCYGERMSNPESGRPKGRPHLPRAEAPRIPKEGALPSAHQPLPEEIRYKPEQQRLYVGTGYVENVTEGMWNYEVSGIKVLTQWFSYRKLDRSRPLIGNRRAPSPLNKIQIDSWPLEYTTDLLDLLHVIGRILKIEPRQSDMLQQVCAGSLFSEDELESSGALRESPGDGKGLAASDDGNQASLIS